MDLLVSEVVERFLSFLWPMIRISALLLDCCFLGKAREYHKVLSQSSSRALTIGCYACVCASFSMCVHARVRT